MQINYFTINWSELGTELHQLLLYDQMRIYSVIDMQSVRIQGLFAIDFSTYRLARSSLLYLFSTDSHCGVVISSLLSKSATCYGVVTTNLEGSLTSGIHYLSMFR